MAVSEKQRKAQPINRREGAHSDFVINIFGELGVARWRFPPTSTQTFGAFGLIRKDSKCATKSLLLAFEFVVADNFNYELSRLYYD